MKHLLILVVALTALAFTTSNLTATEQAPPFKLLKQERDSRDALPKAVLDAPVRRDLGDPSTARRVRTSHGATYWLMRGKEDRVCLVRLMGDDNVTALCVPWRGDAMKTTVVYMAAVHEDGERVITVLAPDGYTGAALAEDGSGAKTARFKDNVAFLSGKRAGTVTVSGSGMRVLTARIARLPKATERLTATGR